MDSSSDEIAFDIPGLIRIFKDGRCQRLYVTNIVQAGIDPSSGVNSKDVVLSPETKTFARLYIPKATSPHQKLPLLIFYHGGGFAVESAASSLYHNFLNLLVSESNIVAVSVDYRLAPEFPLPAAYEDSWEAIKWVANHVNGNGPEPWLNEYPDFKNVFIAGDSVGGNIAHNMAIRVGSDCPEGLLVRGAILLHAYFWGKELVGAEAESLTPEIIGSLNDMWTAFYPGSIGLDDPLVDPSKDPKLAGMGCSKLLVCIGEMDFLRERGWYYKQVIERSGWEGDLEVVEDKGGHLFFLNDLSSATSCALRSRISTFIKT